MEDLEKKEASTTNLHSQISRQTHQQNKPRSFWNPTWSLLGVLQAISLATKNLEDLSDLAAIPLCVSQLWRLRCPSLFCHCLNEKNTTRVFSSLMKRHIQKHFWNNKKYATRKLGICNVCRHDWKNKELPEMPSPPLFVSSSAWLSLNPPVAHSLQDSGSRVPSFFLSNGRSS